MGMVEMLYLTTQDKIFSFICLMSSCVVVIASFLSPLPFLASGNPISLIIGGVLCGSCTIPIFINSLQVAAEYGD
jgi:hypothetical protein